MLQKHGIAFKAIRTEEDARLAKFIGRGWFIAQFGFFFLGRVWFHSLKHREELMQTLTFQCSYGNPDCMTSSIFYAYVTTMALFWVGLKTDRGILMVPFFLIWVLATLGATSGGVVMGYVMIPATLFLYQAFRGSVYLRQSNGAAPATN